MSTPPAISNAAPQPGVEPDADDAVGDTPAEVTPSDPGIPSAFRKHFARDGVGQVLEKYIFIRDNESSYEKRQRNNSQWRFVLGLTEKEIIDLDELVAHDSHFINSILNNDHLEIEIKARLNHPGHRARMIAYLVAVFYYGWKQGLSFQRALENFKSAIAELSRGRKNKTRTNEGPNYSKLYMGVVKENWKLRSEIAELEARLKIVVDGRRTLEASLPKKAKRK